VNPDFASMQKQMFDFVWGPCTIDEKNRGVWGSESVNIATRATQVTWLLSNTMEFRFENLLVYQEAVVLSNKIFTLTGKWPSQLRLV